MNSTAIVTIVSNNYLHFARSLLESVATHHPEADRYCVIVDRDLQYAEALSSEFSLLPLERLNLPDGDGFFFQYNVLELNTAVKPWALAHLIEQGYQNVLYIDPDIVLYRPMHEVFNALTQGADLVLTPHLLSPVTDAHAPGELDIRKSGTYNLGFCALRASDNMRKMLSWWQGKLHRNCIIAHQDGIFVDQSWMDLAPAIFPNVFVLRHPGYNVAYWNLAQRPVEQRDGDYFVCGQPLVFFHFSGLNPLQPATVSKHQNRFTLDNVGAAVASLIDTYAQRVQALGLANYAPLPYGFACYADGDVIPEAERILFRTTEGLREQTGGQPFLRRATITAFDAEAQRSDQRVLEKMYAHLLGRQPDVEALRHAEGLSNRPLRRYRRLWSLATSPESKKKPGWFWRWLSWPVQGALFQSLGVHSRVAPMATSDGVSLVQPKAECPAPYAGLSAPEAGSTEQGLWVGPCLDLPVCRIGAGMLQIEGLVDLGLLARKSPIKALDLEIHAPVGVLHTERLTRSGAFSLSCQIPPAAWQGISQWSIKASASIVPKDCGLGGDTRSLSWRVKRIAVDGVVLVDCARSPSTERIEHLMSPGGINLIGYLAAELGLGEAARSLARACVAANIPFSATDVGFQSQNLQRDTALLNHAVDRHFPIDLLYVNADQTANTVEYLKANKKPGVYRIGYWHWEQPQLPPLALGAFAHVDEVWVPSTFVHDAVAPYAPVPVVKIPHALDFAPSPEARPANFGLPDGKLLVLVMYDFHSYQYRKNPQAALAAFRIAAQGRSDAVLVIKTINGQIYPEARQELQASVADIAEQVLFIDDFLTRQQTWDLQACCDILLSLHRAEGFGLAPAEMMHLGKVVIATGWSANTDFMTADNAFLVRYQLKALESAVGVYPAGQLWAEADIEHAADCLRQALDSAVLRETMGRRAASDIRKQLAPDVVGQQVAQRLCLLSYWNPVLRTQTVAIE